MKIPKEKNPSMELLSGQRTTPSVVAITEDGARLVGDVEKRKVSHESLNFQFLAKSIFSFRS